jgi:hypothetical protein
MTYVLMTFYVKTGLWSMSVNRRWASMYFVVPIFEVTNFGRLKKRGLSDSTRIETFPPRYV